MLTSNGVKSNIFFINLRTIELTLFLSAGTVSYRDNIRASHTVFALPPPQRRQEFTGRLGLSFNSCGRSAGHGDRSYRQTNLLRTLETRRRWPCCQGVRRRFVDLDVYGRLVRSGVHASPLFRHIPFVDRRLRITNDFPRHARYREVASKRRRNVIIISRLCLFCWRHGTCDLPSSRTL